LRQVYASIFVSGEIIRQKNREQMFAIRSKKWRIYGSKVANLWVLQHNRLDQQELTALSLHLLQSCLVYVNTLLIQRVLAEPEQFQRMQQEDLRGLTPLIYSHVTPYGMFRLDLSERIEIEELLSA
jgi:hypothetical protein